MNFSSKLKRSLTNKLNYMEKEQPQNLEKNIQRAFYQKYAIGAIVVIVMFVAWLVVYFLPLQEQITQSEQGIHQWGGKIKAANFSGDTVDRLSQTVDQLKLNIEKIEEKIYYLEDMPLIAKHLLKHGKSYGLEITSMTPNYDVLFEVKSIHSDGKPLIKLPISLQMNGRFKSVGKFISSVGELPFAFAPDGFEFTANPMIYPEVEVTVEGFLFLLNEERKRDVNDKVSGKDNKV